MKKLVLWLGLFGSAFASAQNALEDIQKRDVLRVAIHESAYPFSYLDAQGHWQGADIEIAKVLSQEILGAAEKIEWFPVANRDRIPVLISGDVDLVLANFTRTRSRAAVVDFSEPYMKVNLALISSVQDPIRYLSDLDKKTLIVKEGSTAERIFMDQHHHVTLLPVKKDEELFYALETGEGVAAVHDDTLLWAWEVKHPNFAISMPQISETDFIAAAVNKGEKALLEKVNTVLHEMKKDGRLETIYQKTLAPVFGENRIQNLWVE